MKKHTELFRVFGKHMSNGSVVEDFELEKDDLFYLPLDQPVTDWKPLQCTMIKGNEFFDYQATVHRFRFCSQGLKDLLDAHKSPEDRLQWLDATVTYNGETRPYYVLHFYEEVDVVDYELSGWDGNMFLKEPVFLREKIRNHNVFAIPKSYIMLMIKPEIVTEIKRQKLTGMTFGKADVR